MKNIFVVAEGAIAQNFITMIGKRRVANNNYHIVSSTIEGCMAKDSSNISFYNVDPTSELRVQKLFDTTTYDHAFIIIKEFEDCINVCNNILAVDNKIRLVVVDQWGESDFRGISSHVTIIRSDDLISNHMYDNLPNVPKIAKNVGLGNGEIMEMHIPFGSSYAFRHIGSITQQKWKIVALYRAGKQILPTNATMIRPNDTLLTVGNPMVLDGIYKLINKRKGFFPEPFGKHIFLLLDLRFDSKRALEYIEESIFMLSKLSKRKLCIYVIYPTDVTLVSNIKRFQSENIQVIISFDGTNIASSIEFEISSCDIGIVLCSQKTFKSDDRSTMFYDLRKLVYIFGRNALQQVSKAVLVMKNENKMESISSAVFDICETFEFSLQISDFNSDIVSEESNIIERHYDAMAPLFNTTVNCEYKIANPIREIAKMEHIIEIAPYSSKKVRSSIIEFMLSKSLDFFISANKHPKLLIPFEASDI